MSVSHHTVTESEAEQRIDNFLMRHFREVPKSAIYRILRKGEVRVDKKRVKPDYRLQIGNVVRIPPLQVTPRAETPLIKPEQLSILEQAILLEDDALVVLNKPSGWPVHAGSGLRYGIIEGFRQLRPYLPYIELVHRLDRDTSGLLLLAKSRSVLTELHGLLREGAVHKSYQALVTGVWQAGKRSIELNVQRSSDPVQKVKVTADESGKLARSVVTPQTIYQDCSLLEVQILTGRMHQIRVQLSHLGHPVIGDERYGDFAQNRLYRERGLKRLFLHATRMEFMLTTSGQRYSLHAPLPEHLQKILNTLKKY